MSGFEKLKKTVSFVSEISSFVSKISWLRSVALGAICLCGVALYLKSIWTIYPPSDWLFLKVAALWAWCGLLHGACVVFGHTIISRVIKPGPLPFQERLVSDMAVGLVAFVLMMYAAGALALYSTSFALILPGLMIGLSLPTLWKEYATSPKTPAQPSAGYHPLMIISLGLGVLCLALLYLQTLTPSALNYDSKWYHLTIGEDYAREGRIVPFAADYNKAAFPQLTGFIYTWGCLLPGLDTPLRVMFILHNEFMLLIWTLVGVSATVQWFLGGRAAPGAWTAFFLFPGIFVYDSNIGGSADHVLGFFALPIFLAAMRASERFEERRCVLLGAFVGGAILTKYQAVYMIVGVTPVIMGRWFFLLLKARRQVGRSLWLGPMLIVVSSLAVSSPHFLKNWIFYENPIYPYLTSVFAGSHPIQPETAASVANMWMERSLRPEGTLWTRFGDAFKLIFSFSFEPHYSVSRPVFGSLFTLLLPASILVKDKRRLLLGVLVTCAALGFWASSYLVDRYLQTFIGMFVAVTAALIVRVWQAGLIARLSVFVLIATQLVWSSDALFYSGYERIVDSINLIRSGYEGRAATRFDNYLRDTRAIDKRLPKDAVLLFHNTRLSLGVNRRVYQDLAGYQSLISYRNVKSARQLVELYRSFGITHIVHERGKWQALTRQEEVVFSTFLARYAGPSFRQGQYEVVELPRDLPPDEATYLALSLGLPGYQDGVYPADTMPTVEPLPRELKTYAAPAKRVKLTDAAAHVKHVDVVLIRSGVDVPKDLRAVLSRKFTHLFTCSALVEVYVKKR